MSQMGNCSKVFWCVYCGICLIWPWNIRILKKCWLCAFMPLDYQSKWHIAQLEFRIMNPEESSEMGIQSVNQRKLNEGADSAGWECSPPFWLRDAAWDILKDWSSWKWSGRFVPIHSFNLVSSQLVSSVALFLLLSSLTAAVLPTLHQACGRGCADTSSWSPQARALRSFIASNEK